MVDIAKGKFERTDAQNYDDFLKALDVNFLLRKAATASTPVMEVRDILYRFNQSNDIQITFKVTRNFKIDLLDRILLET